MTAILTPLETLDDSSETCDRKFTYYVKDEDAKRVNSALRVLAGCTDIWFFNTWGGPDGRNYVFPVLDADMRPTGRHYIFQLMQFDSERAGLAALFPDALTGLDALRAENAALKDQLAHIGCAGMSAMPKKIGGGP